MERSFGSLNESIKAGKIAESVLDASLMRTLPIRFELGQLDGATAAEREGVPDNSFQRLNRRDNVSTPAMIELALVAAKKAIILLKNSRRTLPLRKADYADGTRSLCMFGPNANNSKATEAGYGE